VASADELVRYQRDQDDFFKRYEEEVQVRDAERLAIDLQRRGVKVANLTKVRKAMYELGLRLGDSEEQANAWAESAVKALIEYKLAPPIQ